MGNYSSDRVGKGRGQVGNFTEELSVEMEWFDVGGREWRRRRHCITAQRRKRGSGTST